MKTMIELIKQYNSVSNQKDIVLSKKRWWGDGHGQGNGDGCGYGSSGHIEGGNKVRLVPPGNDSGDGSCNGLKNGNGSGGGNPVDKITDNFRWNS